MSQFLRKLFRKVNEMCSSTVLTQDDKITIDSRKLAIAGGQTTNSRACGKARKVSITQPPSPAAGSSLSLELIDPVPAYSTPPIERFRQEYGHISGLLRERCMYDPHPRSDHVWIAAHLVNRFGLYHPCVSLEVDYANAVKLWETSQPKKPDVTPRQPRVCNTPNHPFHDEICHDHKTSYAEHAWELKRKLTEAAEEATKVATFHALSLIRGIKAGRDIILHQINKEPSAMRCKELFDRGNKELNHEESADRLSSILEKEIRMTIAESHFEFDWEQIEGEEFIRVTAGEDMNLSSFAHVDGGVEVENGEPMVTRGCMRKLYQAIIRY